MINFVKNQRWFLVDILLVSIALGQAYIQRLLPLVTGFQPTEPNWKDYFTQAVFVIPAFTCARLIIFRLFDLYSVISRFASVHELRRIVLAVSSGTLILILWNSLQPLPLFLLDYMPEDINLYIPKGVILGDWMGCLILVGGARFAKRVWGLTRFNSTAAIHNVLIIGANDVGETVSRNFLNNPQMGYRPVGYVDEDPALLGRQIHGLRVHGALPALPKLIDELSVAEVIVAERNPSLPFLNRIVETCAAAHVGFKMIPAVSDVMQERVSVNQIRPVEIEDLLGREPVDLTLDDDMNYLENEIVLVTGAGGSIGSELCRQIRRNRPKRLVLLGRGENSIHEIALELGYSYHDDSLQIEIADIQDVDRIEAIFIKHRPSVVFHAAAHKHVPLMELHPHEAVKNNIIGTFNVAFLAKRSGAKRFTMISTDKAVRPTNVMGATKRVAEMIVSALSQDSETTTYLSVRFGNVLGSRGSVVPIFRKQIADGGPVTVMHKDIERYFMTIPEASNLVLQAGAIGRNGQLFILDMGQPVKIVDLARRMITLSGYEPDRDIDIHFVGLRPGEKLKEELLTDSEDLSPTEHHKIIATRVTVEPTMAEIKEWLRVFDHVSREGDADGVIAALQTIVPEYQPARNQPPPPAPESNDIEWRVKA